MPLPMFFWIIGFLITLLGGCFAIFKYFSVMLSDYVKSQDAKHERIYQRMDEHKVQDYRDFLTKEVYESDCKTRKEIIDVRFEQVVLLFNEKIESLRHEIRGLVLDGYRKDNNRRDNNG